jgi:hypothetical protein
LNADEDCSNLTRRAAHRAGRPSRRREFELGCGAIAGRGANVT